MNIRTNPLVRRSQRDGPKSVARLLALGTSLGGTAYTSRVGRPRTSVGTARRRGLRLTVVAVVCGLVAAANAQAATYTVGSPLTAAFAPAAVGSTATFINAALPDPGANVASPVTGVIVRWRVTQASGGPFKLRVITPVSGTTTDTGAGTSVPQSPRALTTHTFTTNLPIRTGQLIGLDNTNGTDQIGAAAATGASFVIWAPPLADGETATNTAAGGGELGFNADVVAQPGVGSLAPSSGPGLGGTPVTITGHDYSGATAVSFGGVPARSFTVNSDTSITAVSPTAPAGVLDVTVTTAGGQSPVTSAGRFTSLPAPSITSISPSQVARTGGTRVTIAGAGFTGASAVSFGGRATSSFTVRSDASITAVSPAAPAGAVDVIVTTPNGQSTTVPADRFTFNQVCVVPKLEGMKLKAATKALKKANCKLGNVLPKGRRTGAVKHQSLKVGKVLPAGTNVNIKLG